MIDPQSLSLDILLLKYSVVLAEIQRVQVFKDLTLKGAWSLSTGRGGVKIIVVLRVERKVMFEHVLTIFLLKVGMKRIANEAREVFVVEKLTFCA